MRAPDSSKYQTTAPFLVSNAFRATMSDMENMTPESLGSSQEKKESWWDVLKFAIIAICIVVPIRVFIAQPFVVSGSSMVPTFHTSDYLIIDELTYRLHEPHRGDVIVFRYPKDTSKFFIKRVIGLPGETISVTTAGITIKNSVHPEGFKLSEDYITPQVGFQSPVQKTLADGEYFVLGDNRPASSDSRIWGTVPRQNIVGRAFLRLFPLSGISVMPGVHTNYGE